MLTNAYYVMRDYFRLTTRSQKLTDISIASFTFLLLLILYYKTGASKAEPILDMLGFLITILSVLSGFNLASITIISSSQSPVLEQLKGKKIERLNYEYNEFQQLVSYFCWAIIIQLVMLLSAIFLYFLISFSLLTTHIGTIGLFIITAFSTYSIILSIKNIVTLYLFLIIDDGKHNT